MTSSEADHIVRELSELGPEERTRWFDEHGTPPELREEVLRVLSHVDALMASPDALPTPAPFEGGLRPEDAPMPETLGPYRVRGQLGSGGMGVVYLAEQAEPRREVAVKVMNAGLLTTAGVKRFEREAQLLGRLQHPGIAQIHELGRTEAGATYLVMEYVDGQRLGEYAAEQHLDQPERVALLADLADAVHHAHLRSVLHRDLKPANVLVTDDGQVKVIDFGVARALDTDAEATMETAAGQIVGTLTYMSPEQLRGQVDAIDGRADVYALGVMAYELLGGELPHDVKTATLGEAVRVVCETDPRPLGRVAPSCRGDLEHIVGKALEKEPERRYQSAAAFGDDLRRFLDNRPVEARPPSTAYQLRKFARRNRGLVGGVAAALVAVIVGTSVAVYQAVENKTLATKESEARRDAELAAAAATRSADEAARNAEEAARNADTATRNAEEAEAQKQLAEANARAAEESAAAAEEARAAEAQRAGELAVLVDFQQSELDRINAASMGETIRLAIINDLVRLWRDVERRPQGEVDARHAQLDAWLRAADLTYVSTWALHDTLLEPSRRLIDERLADQPVAQGKLLRRLGTSYSRLGFAEKQLECFERAATLLRDALGPTDVETLTAQVEVGRALSENGRRGDMVRLYEALHPVLLKLLGPGHELTLEVVMGLANEASTRGDMDGAIALLRDAVEAAEGGSGQGEKLVPVVQALLARHLMIIGEYAEAEALQRAALAQYIAEGAGDRPPSANVRADLAVNLSETGRLDEAIPLLEEALADRVRILGRKDPANLESMNHLGIMHLLNGDPASAKPVLAEALTLQSERVRHGENEIGKFRTYLWALADYGACLNMLEEYDEAREVLESAHAHSQPLPEGDEQKHEIAVRLRETYEGLAEREPAGGWIEKADGMGLPHESLP